MKNFFDYFSLVAVGLFVFGQLYFFNLYGSYAKGPLNPYAFFTDDVRLALENASAKVRNGELTEEDARDLSEKYDVRRCIPYDDGDVLWEIPFCSINSVEYVYSPKGTYDPSFKVIKVVPLGNNWYWWVWR